MDIRHVIHTFPLIADEHSKVLILGSVPSLKSVGNGFYYMHKQNRFWSVVSALIGEDMTSLDACGKASALKTHGIALYDAIAECDIVGSSDVAVSAVVPAPIPDIVERYHIAHVFCNGAKAYETIKKYYPELLPMTDKLPSTSPANAACDKQKLIESWSAVLAFSDKA